MRRRAPLGMKTEIEASSRTSTTTRTIRAGPGGYSQSRLNVRRVGILGALALAAAACQGGCRGQPAPRAAPAPPGFLEQAREMISGARSLPIEVEVAARPEDAGARRRLADACRPWDPCGVVLALYPLAIADRRGAAHEECLTAMAALGWLEEAEKLTEVPLLAAPRVRLLLAEAYAVRGRADRAATLLASLEEPEVAELSAEDLIRGARVWLKCRRAERAVASARRGASLRLGQEGPLLALTESLLAAGRPEEALAELPPAPRSPTLEHWRARCERNSRSPVTRAAGTDRLRSLAAGPEEPAIGFASAEAEMEARQWETAVALLERVSERGHQQLLCLRRLAVCYAALGRRADAAQARGEAALLTGRTREAEDEFRRALALKPDSLESLLSLSRSLSSQGRLAESLQVLRRPPPPLARNMNVALLRAAVLGRMERVREQIAELRAAADLDPARRNEPLGELGKLYYSSQQFAEARKVLEEALAAEDGDALAHQYLGLTLRQVAADRPSTEAAALHLLRAARVSGRYFYPWMNAGSAMQALGHDTEAAACFRAAINRDARWEAPYASLAALLQKQGRAAERELVLRQYARTRELEALRLRLENAAGLRPRDAKARLALGERLLRDGLPGEALGELQIAYGVAPADRTIRSRLADCCAVLGYRDMQSEVERGTP